MVDERRLADLLERIADQLNHLHRLATMDAEELLGDEDLLAAVKYRFIVAIEASVEACYHVISSERLRVADSFADAFMVLGEAGFVPPDRVAQLQTMARFRNLLVHGYARVDDARVVAILHSRLGELDDFRRALASRLS